MSKALLSLCLLLFPNTIAIAQTPVADQNDSFAWNQDAATQIEANGLTYAVYEGTVKKTLTSVVCTGTATPFACTALVGTWTNGAHTVQFTAANSGGESLKSAPFVFDFVTTANTPTSFRIIRNP